MDKGVCLIVLLMVLCVSSELVPVEGHASDFVYGVIKGAKLTLLETGDVFYTDHEGYFNFSRPVGSTVTVLLEKFGYHPTQTGTVTVPESGLVGVQHELTLQVPDTPTYDFLVLATGLHARSDRCHFVVTVTAACLTLHDDPQGEANATTKITGHGKVTEPPFYFGIWDGKFTNPFSRGLTVSSEDGGVLWFNAEEGDYIVTAQKEGVVFGDPATSVLRCVKADGRLVNASPPWGPRAQSNKPCPNQ